MKVLLATDGSKFTEATTQSVISLLRAQDSEVLVLQIVEPVVFSTPPHMAPGYAPEMAARLQSQIKGPRSRFPVPRRCCERQASKQIHGWSRLRYEPEFLTSWRNGSQIWSCSDRMAKKDCENSSLGASPSPLPGMRHVPF